MATDRLQPFPWYGGKFSHLEFLLPRLPDKPHYVEPFGGSAAVLLSREPADVETYNDIDGDVTTFFQVLRDRPDELISQLDRTPYSREEYLQAIDAEADDQLDDLERARLFFVRATQVYAGLAQYATPGRWSYSRSTSVNGMSNNVAGYQSNVDDLEAVADRLQRVQIEHDDALAVIDRYDHQDALIYCDPPYPMVARGTAGNDTADPVAYRDELTADDHRELAETLRSCEADVAVSSYRSDFYDELFDGWHVATDAEKGIRTKHNTGHDARQEVLYTTYDPERVRKAKQASLASFWGAEY